MPEVRPGLLPALQTAGGERPPVLAVRPRVSQEGWRRDRDEAPQARRREAAPDVRGAHAVRPEQRAPGLGRVPRLAHPAGRGRLRSLRVWAALGPREGRARDTPATDAHRRDAGRLFLACLLYTSDAADDLPCVDLGG